MFDISTDDDIRLHIAHAKGHALVLVGPHGVIQAEGIVENDVVKRVEKRDIRDALGDVEGTPFVRAEIHAVGGAVRALGQAIRL